MLKDITLGQYFPGNSPVHRLDPRTKLVLLVVYIVALFLAVSWVSYGIMFAFLALAGDVGCSGGPTLVGMVSGAFGDNLKVGILMASVFPIVMLLCLFRGKLGKNDKN